MKITIGNQSRCFATIGEEKTNWRLEEPDIEIDLSPEQADALRLWLEDMLLGFRVRVEGKREE